MQNSSKNRSFTDALGKLGGGDMDSTRQIIVGNQRFNIDKDVTTGKALVNVDSSENRKRGEGAEYKGAGYWEEYGGSIGGTIAAGFVGLGVAEAIARKVGMENGIVKPMAETIKNKFKNSVSGESNNQTFNRSPNSSQNSNYNKSADGTEKKRGNGVEHGNSFDGFEGKKYNVAGQETAEYKAYKESLAKKAEKGKGFFSYFDRAKEMFGGKSGKTALSAAAISAVGYTLFGGSDAEAKEFPAKTPVANDFANVQIPPEGKAAQQNIQAASDQTADYAQTAAANIMFSSNTNQQEKQEEE